jgi:hypothetical protein
MTDQIQFITNARGERTAVILPIEEYENLLEDFHVLSAAYESRNEPTRPFNEVIAEMRAAGEIDI